MRIILTFFAQSRYQNPRSQKPHYLRDTCIRIIGIAKSTSLKFLASFGLLWSADVSLAQKQIFSLQVACVFHCFWSLIYDVLISRRIQLGVYYSKSVKNDNWSLCSQICSGILLFKWALLLWTCSKCLEDFWRIMLKNLFFKCA